MFNSPFCSTVNAAAFSESLVRVTTQSGFGPVVNGVITATRPIYYLGNDVTIEDGVSLVFDPAINANVTLRADSLNVNLRGNVGPGAAFVQMPNQGVITNIAVTNEGNGDVVLFSSRSTPIIDAAANFCVIHEASIVSPSNFSSSQAVVRMLGDGSGGRFPPRLRISSSNLGSFASEGTIVFEDGSVDFMDISNALIPNPVGPSITMAADFTGFIFGAGIMGGTLGSDVGPPSTSIELVAGGSILVPGAGRLFLVTTVNLGGGIVGFTTADPDVIFNGNQGIQDSLFLGAGGFTGNATATVINTQGVFETINDGGLMTTNPQQQRFTRSGLEFTYDGLVARNCNVSWHISVTAVAGNPLVECRVEVDSGAGFVAVANSTFIQEATNRQGTFGADALFLIEPDDIVRLTIANVDNTTNIEVNAMDVVISAT